MMHTYLVPVDLHELDITLYRVKDAIYLEGTYKSLRNRLEEVPPTKRDDNILIIPKKARRKAMKRGEEYTVVRLEVQFNIASFTMFWVIDDMIVKEREVPIVANATTPRRLGPAGGFPSVPPRAGMRSQSEKGTKSGVSQVILLKGKRDGKRKTKGKGKKGKE